MDNEIWEQLNKISLEEDLDKEFESIIGPDKDQVVSLEDFLEQSKKIREFHKKCNNLKK